MSYYLIAPDGSTFGPGASAEAVHLPELTTKPCASCQGFGYHGTLELEDGWRCETCDGCGVIEICSGCRERPTVIARNEACGCTFATTKEAVCETCERVLTEAELDMCSSMPQML